MDKDYVLQIAETIRGQLVSLTEFPVLLSWGITEFVGTVFKDLPALRFHVNGRLFKGFVIICLNGSDYYEVYLQNGEGTRCINDEVCFNELGEVIDREIERGTDKAEYDKFCSEQFCQLLK